MSTYTVISETSAAGVGQKRIVHWYDYTQTVSRLTKSGPDRIAADGGF